MENQEISETQKILNKIVEENKNKRHNENILCPYCEHEQDTDILYNHVSYWGDDSLKLISCESCNKQFYVKELVERTFETTTKEWIDEKGVLKN